MSAPILVHGVLWAADAARLEADVIAHDDLAALVSREADSPAAAQQAEAAIALALRHHERLSAAAARCDILPVRLGAFFGDEAAVRAMLAGAASAFRDRLQIAADAIEMALVVEDLGPPAEPPGPSPGGVAYLRARAAALDADRRRGPRIAEALAGLEAELGAVARLTVRRPIDRQRGGARIFELALLIQRRAIQTASLLVSAKTGAAAALGLRIALDGPWPVYSFASVPSESAP